MATFKHISSKNADYGAAEAYLTFEHDEFTMKPTLDENGRLIPREDYRISSLNCGGEDFAVACMRANLRYEKNQKREDVKSHHYIISFDPRDGTDNGLTVDRAQELGEQFCKEHFPGHQALVCTHPDGHNHSGNIHVHIVINSLRIYEVPLLPYMDRPADTREGCKHRCTNAAMEYFKSEVMEMCHREGLYQIDLLSGSKERITEREYWAAKKGQLALDKENAVREAAGQPTKPTKFETDKAKLRRTIRQALSQAGSFDEFSSLLLREGVTVKESRGRLSYLTPDRTKPITARKLGDDFDKAAVLVLLMSRLGRNYLQVGMYTEMIFPQKGVRFIAINDGVDSAQGDNDFAPLRNIFNEWLVRDTSKKIKAVKRSKGMNGKPITSKPVYGYLMDEDENFIIDEEAAPVVKQIYNLCLAGNGPTKIARMLTEQQIPTPGTLEYRRTGSTRRYHPGYECKWATNTVVHILENREYTGCLVNFKTEKLSYKVKHSVENPPEKQVIFENHHEPIIDTQTWERVQELRKQRKRPNRYDEVGLFSGILFCADCGSVMYQQRYQTDKRKQDCYICGNYKKRTHDCTAHFIRTDLLTAGVLSNLRKVTSYAAKHEARFMKLLIEQNEDGGKRRNAAKKKELEASEKRIAELSAIFKRLYEDSVTGRISDERFTELSADYEAEQRELKERAAAIQAELSKAQEATVNAEKFMNVVRRHTSFEELTPTLLREFVEKIVVHECSYDENKTRRQDIEIYYSFVGKVDLPE